MILRPSAVLQALLLVAAGVFFTPEPQQPLFIVTALSVNLAHKSKASAVYAVYDVIESLQQQTTAWEQHSSAAFLNSNTNLQTALDGKEVSASDKLEILDALKESQKTKSVYDSAYATLIRFSNTVSQTLGAEPQAATCEQITCGKHAFCDKSSKKCVCEDGFIGDGMLCRAPSSFVPEKMFPDELAGTKQAHDVDTVSFTTNDGKKQVGVVFRNSKDDERGYLLVGDVTEAKVDFKTDKVLLVSGETAAYGLRVIVLPRGKGNDGTRLAITYRDARQAGTAFMTIVSVGVDKETDKNVVPEIVAQNIDAPLATIALNSKSAVVFYPATSEDPEGNVLTNFGAATVVDVTGEKAKKQGKFRFYEKLVSDINAVNIGNNKFVVGFRGKRYSQDADGKKGGEEAALVLGHQTDMELVFDPEIMNVKPDGNQLLNHDLSLVSQNEVALSYYNAGMNRAEVGLVTIDFSKAGPHRMEQIDGYPKLVLPAPADMTSVFLNQKNSVSMPFVGSGNGMRNVPRTFFYFLRKPRTPVIGGTPVQNIIGRACAIPKDDDTQPMCSENSIASGVDVGPIEPLQGYADNHDGVISATPLGFPGRMLFVYTDKEGTAYFQILVV